MTEEIILYTNPYSRGRVARWMLEEVGASYRSELLDLGVTAKQPAYLAINPMGKVPAIRQGETVVTETAAICAYLADAFPRAALAPSPESRLRGPYYRWLLFAAGPVEQLISAVSCGWTVPRERRGMVGFGSLERVQDTLSSALEGREYLVGDIFTAADLYMAAELDWGLQLGIFQRRQAFVDYAARMSARQAAVRAAAKDNELLASQQVQT